MSEEWKTLAEQIAGLKRQLGEVQHELNNTKACLHARNTALNGAQGQVKQLTRERDQYKAMCEVHDAQLRAGIITRAVPDDVINITVKRTK